ncbi:MAG: hypothetical protein HYZ66_10130 [Chlamydiae bacterium]|nr:hypothetical protein [Chlamydiota bacterium]
MLLQFLLLLLLSLSFLLSFLLLPRASSLEPPARFEFLLRARPLLLAVLIFFQHSSELPNYNEHLQ